METLLEYDGRGFEPKYRTRVIISRHMKILSIHVVTVISKLSRNKKIFSPQYGKAKKEVGKPFIDHSFVHSLSYLDFE